MVSNTETAQLLGNGSALLASLAPALLAHAAVSVSGSVCRSGRPSSSAALRLRCTAAARWCLLSSHVAKPRPSPVRSGSLVPEPLVERKTSFRPSQFCRFPTSVFSPVSPVKCAVCQHPLHTEKRAARVIWQCPWCSG